MNLEDIAKLSGVSRSTVSRVLNNDPNVRESTRRRVQDVIRRVNFQPNLAARSLATGHARVIGLVIPMGVATMFTDPYFPMLIKGISAACNANDYSVMLWLAEPEYERRTVNQVLHNGMIEGVVVASVLMDDPIVQALINSQMPFVLIGRHPTNPNVNYVDVDNRTSSRQLMEHLIGQGYRRIATITGAQNMIAGSDRLLGYMDALTQNGIPIDMEMIAPGNFTEEGGYSAMQRILPHAPDAVFVASDTMALGALRAIQQAGLRVPDDIALTGFDDMPFAARLNPPLTTVHQPVEETGMKAAETLFELLTDPESGPVHRLVATELVVRASTGVSQSAPLADPS